MTLFDFGAPTPRQDRDYCLERADFHLDLGDKTADTSASWAHYQRAGRYLDRVYGKASAEQAEAPRIAELTA